MSEGNAVITKRDISFFFEDDWFSDSSSSTALMRAYVTINLPLKKQPDFQKMAVRSVDTGFPVKITWCRLQGFHAWFLDTYLHTLDTGDFLLLFDPQDVILPPADYAIFAAPFESEGKALIEEKLIKQEFDRLASLIRAVMGRNALFHTVFEGVYSASTGRCDSTSKTIPRWPTNHEGPFSNRARWQTIEDIQRKIEILTDSDKKNRLKFAIELFGKGFADVTLGLFFYWSAFEILCDGGSGTIRNKLLSSFGVPKYDWKKDDPLGFEAIRCNRNMLVHQGLHQELPIGVERYIHCLFVDLLRHELGLSHMDYAGGLRKSPGWDLSGIGLKDTRSEEQKSSDPKKELQEAKSSLRPANKETIRIDDHTVTRILGAQV